MGSHLLPLFTYSTCSIPSSLTLLNPKLPNPNIRIRFSFTSSPFNSGSDPSSTSRISFNRLDDFYTDGDDDDDDEFGFGFRDNDKERIWWSDDDFEIDDGDEFFLFKIFRDFGWMLPAVAISSLIGTGSNALLMALAVPLGQFVLSMAIDNLWGSKNIRHRRRRRPTASTKQKPFAKASSKFRSSEEERPQNNETSMGRGKVHNDDKGKQKFGGWDELDRLSGKTPKREATQKANGFQKQQKGGKLSRRRRTNERPLFLRLLIAIFPMLGSWTRLLF